MDLRQLKYFIAVIDHGNLTRAAAALHVSQPTLGEHMRNLEEELDVALFVRHSRGITPTPAAMVLRERAEHLLGYARDTRRIVRDAAGTVRGTVTLGISPGLNEMFSADLIERARQVLPGTSINIVEELSGVLIERAERGTEPLDLALVSGFDLGVLSRAAHERVAREHLYLVGVPQRLGHDPQPIAFRELARHPLLLLGSGDARRPYGLRRRLHDLATAQAIELHIETELRSVAAVRELIERDFGAALLPLFTVRPAVAAGQLVARRVVDPDLVREIHLIRAGQAQAGRAVNAVRELLLELVEAHLDTPDGHLQRVAPVAQATQ